jgi:hypothetical protein
MASGIRDIQVKSDFYYFPLQSHHIRAGISITWHHFTPSSSKFRDDFASRREEHQYNYEAYETGLYIEDEIVLSPRWKANAGIRLSSFGGLDKPVFRPEPRITTVYRIQKDLSVKASFSVMNQYIHLLSNSGIGLPTDLWVPSTEKVPNQFARQFAVGMARDLPHNLCLTLESYHKESQNVITYREGASFIQIDNPSASGGLGWEQKVTSGKGLSYGFELLLQRNKGNFNGWLGYTVSWTTLQFDEINQGKPYYARYDRRHDLSLVGIYKITKAVTLSATWVYGTGNAITPPLAAFFAYSHNPGGIVENYRFIQGLLVNDYGDRNSVRMPAYHRFDLAVAFHKKRKRFERTIEISVYNMYNRKNAFFYYVAYSYKGGVESRTLRQISLFPIIPSVSYNFIF